MNLYALEQHIIGCWNICDDIETLEEQGASMADMTALSTIYKYKFQKLWDEYETLLQHASKQCSSCGGFCGRGGCKRENVKPKEWVGLTDEEIDTWNIVGHESLRDFVRAIEDQLRQKNT
jgi:hypothetical protein